jgi:hypothetical protein
MDRRTNKKKLSKHLLEMKFMKRTREKTELQVDMGTSVCFLSVKNQYICVAEPKLFLKIRYLDKLHFLTCVPILFYKD